MLAFENGSGGLHQRFTVDMLRSLVSAGRSNKINDHDGAESVTSYSSCPGNTDDPNSFQLSGDVSLDDRFQSQTVSPFHSVNTGVQLVVVAACYSQFAGEAFVDAGVPHVVAVRCFYL